MILVIGIGNPDRGDDAGGLDVAWRVREAAAPEGDRTGTGRRPARPDRRMGGRHPGLRGRRGLLGRLAGNREPVDAARALPGGPAPRQPQFSLADVIGSPARSAGCPGELVRYGIEGASVASATACRRRRRQRSDAVVGLLLDDLRAGV